MIDLTSSRPLGSTDLTVGGLGLGVAPLGNLFTRGQRCRRASDLAAAERLGISWFDVAPVLRVRAGGNAARVSSCSTRRLIDAPYQRRWGGFCCRPTVRPAHPQYVAASPNQPVFDYTRAGIERSYQDSLKRLGVDRVQILLLHDVDRLSHRHGSSQARAGFAAGGAPGAAAAESGRSRGCYRVGYQ